MGYRSLINKFTSGELDPRLLGEVDYEGYRKGARKLRNVLCIPQGAAQRRFGTDFNAAILDENGDYITDEDSAKLIAYEYLSSEIYWLVLKDNGNSGVNVDIYLDDVLQTTVLLGSYVPADIPNIRWEEATNSIIFFNESYMPVILRRTSAAVWTSLTMVLSLYPTDDYSSLDSPDNNYTNNGTTFTPNAVAATTITASTAVFTSNHSGISPNAGGLFFGNGGVFRIVSVNAAGTIATGYALVDFADTSAIKGSDAKLAERAWGDGSVQGSAPAGASRGYPRHGAIFQSRFIMGGNTDAPGAAHASEVKEYLSFDDSNTEPSSGWGVEVGITGSDEIREFVSGKTLVILSSKGSSSTNILVEAPVTPLNVYLTTQGREGARNIDSVILNNQIMYADRAGNTIWSMIYDVPDSGYSVINASILSSHLIREPQWAAVFDPPDVDGRYYLLVNADGTMAIFNSILEENIKAWSLATTTGKFIDVAAVANQAKVLVKRKVSTDTSVGDMNDIYTVDSTFNVFRSIIGTIVAGSGTTVLSASDSYVLIGNEIPFTEMNLTFDTPASADLQLEFEFLAEDGTWESFTPTDGTAGFTSDGTIEWTFTGASMDNWGAKVIENAGTVYGDGQVLYWMRVRRTNSASVTAPIVDAWTINTESRIYLEQLLFSEVMDSVITTTANSIGLIMGLEHLSGQNVFVFANTFPLGTYYIDTDGLLLIPEAADADIIVGLDYKPYIVPMPLVALLQNGYSVYEPQHIKSIYIDYYESLGVTVNGQNVPQVVPGLFMTDYAPVPDSGYYELPSYGGWDPRVDITISQSYPAKMTIRGISYEVEIG